MDNGPGVFDNVRHDRHDSIDLIPTIGKVVQKYRDIVVRIRTSVAACAGAVKHDPLDSVAIKCIERGAKTGQDGGRMSAA